MRMHVPAGSRPDCARTAAQIKSLRPKEMSNKRLSRPAKTVHRIYGGHLSHRVVKDRIVRAFLIEEQKIIKKVGVPLVGTQ